jgi:hypothetical protein
MATKDTIADIKFKSLRHCIGLLGLALPLMIVLVACNSPDCNEIQHSISHYYYTTAGPIFVGILSCLGLILIFYPTPDPESTPYSTCNWRICRLIRPGYDSVLTSISGILAICVAFFPTNSYESACALFSYTPSALRAGFHYVSAAGMLLIFSYMSICIFTRTNDLHWKSNKWKVWRNHVYMWSGMITFLSVASVGVLAILDAFTTIRVPSQSTYWLEVSALVPFGISWLVKGGFMLTNDGDPSTLEQARHVLATGEVMKAEHKAGKK